MSQFSMRSLIDRCGAEPVPLGAVPTPLEYRAEMSRDLGIEVYLKREDRIDDLGCGNKVRKLSYLLGDAARRGATVLVTAGSVPSNQCKAVAAFASRRGLRAHVIFGGDRQARPRMPLGNYLITTLLEPTVTWCEYAPWSQIESALQRVAEEEQRLGQAPYVIPPGASAWPGLLGSVELGLELAAQAREAGLAITDIIAPAGSGGTCLGIKIAAEQLGLPWRVVGVCIGEPAETLTARAASLRREAAPYLGEGGESGLVYYDGARGGGYDMPDAEELDAMRAVVGNHGLLFDPNYMVKAYLGTRRLIADGTLRRGSRVVLVHTGGQVGFFGGGEALGAWLRRRFPAWVREGNASSDSEEGPHG